MWVTFIPGTWFLSILGTSRSSSIADSIMSPHQTILIEPTIPGIMIFFFRYRHLAKMLSSCAIEVEVILCLDNFFFTEHLTWSNYSTRLNRANSKPTTFFSILKSLLQSCYRCVFRYFGIFWTHFQKRLEKNLFTITKLPLWGNKII